MRWGAGQVQPPQSIASVKEPGQTEFRSKPSNEASALLGVGTSNAERQLSTDILPTIVVGDPLPFSGLPQSRSNQGPKWTWPWTLLLMWLGGVFLLLGRVIWHSLQLNRQLARHQSAVNQSLLDALDEAQTRMGVRRVLPLIQSAAVRSPALMGFIRPWLLLPKGMEERFTKQQLRLIFMHELAHLKRHDIAVNWIMTLLQILHWFNPMIWLAAKRMGTDREMASDQLALSLTNQSEDKAYGNTIIKLLEGLSISRAKPGLICIVENKHQIAKRIKMIATFRETKKWPALALASLVGLALVGLTNANVQTTVEAATTQASNSNIILKQISKSGKEVQGRVSIDGSLICFWDHDPENIYKGNLVISALRNNTVRSLLDKESLKNAGYVAALTLAYDGSKVAYLWVKDGADESPEFRIVNTDGTGSSRQLGTPKEKPWIYPEDWAPDGNRIVATRIHKEPVRGRFEKSLVLVSPVDGSVDVLTTHNNRFFSPRFSPDGRYLTYNRRNQAGNNVTLNDIFLFDIEKRTEVPLIDHPANDEILGWIPNSNRLLFTSDRRGDIDLWASDISEDNTAAEPILLKENLGRVYPMGITKEGSFYYGIWNVSQDLYTAEIDLTSGKQLSKLRNISGRFFGDNYQASWSPDGSLLAYMSRRKEISVISVLNWATKQERAFDIKPPASLATRLSLYWASDGSSIRFRGNGNGSGLFSLDTTTGNFSTIVRDESLGEEGTINAFASPPTTKSDDGRSIQFVRRENSNLTLVSRVQSSGDEKVTVIESPDHLTARGFPTILDFERQIAAVIWNNSTDESVAILHDLKEKKNLVLVRSKYVTVHAAPDSRHFVVLSIMGEKEIKKIHGFIYTNSRLDQLYEVEFPAESHLHQWTPDSRFLTFSKTITISNGFTQELWTIAADTGEMKRTELSMKAINDVAVQPKGNTVVVKSEEEVKSVWVMENLGL